MYYKVYMIKEIKNPLFGKGSEDEIIGGDHELIWHGKQKAKCWKYAKDVSTQTQHDGSKVHETMLEEFENLKEDRTHQWYFKNGIMTHDMGEGN